ncbi:copper resistance protein CopC [Microbispora sp. RL4-1S]|uniref:Copper resistance protein CopC n=1 Tax=Microbispora oryzae TaxID=2806554 RepID=A0A940WL54_9ACTN|nr:copper resistance CopC family protein [Microbispora oryzae]MBP2702564.1 copper resistance protein CopC [Microbispora oryzae]
MKKTILAAVAFAVAFLLSVAPALPAQAHTSLRSSDPKSGAQVDRLSRVVLEFTESVRFPVVVVNGPDGKRYESGEPTVDGPRVTEAVTGGAPPGRYTIAWRVVSSDGHPVEGEIPFTLTGGGSAGTATAAGPAAQNSAAAQAPGTQAPGSEPADASADSGSGTVPGWVWAVIFGIAGIGIGMFLSLRKKP